MFLSLDGKVNFYMNMNGHQVYYFTFENNHVTGGVGGMMPYSRMQTYPGFSYASGTARLLRMHKKHFHELEQLNPAFIQRLIGYMTERARIFATTQLQHEKVNALGTLAAGIAHELNNPAAAINRISSELASRVQRNVELTRKLLQSNITAEQLIPLQELLPDDTAKTNQPKLTALQRMEREDALSDWLEQNGITERTVSETFSEAGISAEDLEKIQSAVGAAGFVKVLPWLENELSCTRILKDLSDASSRISNLVSSIKSHVQMDRNGELQPTDIQKDLENTLTLLGFKLRGKNIEVIRKFDGSLPMVPAFVGELNQVWTNIIDNAIYAMPKNGQLTLQTSCDEKNAIVCIGDNGPGIPKEIVSRIFEPFFTTKKVGEGNGIGLDIVMRIIKRHNGEIQVNSVPGKTEFKICLPLKQL
jgi:signal transduction histidine kinase